MRKEGRAFLAEGKVWAQTQFIGAGREGELRSLTIQWSKIMALEPSEGFSRKMIGSKLCLRRKWTTGRRSCEDVPGSVSEGGMG